MSGSTELKQIRPDNDLYPVATPLICIIVWGLIIFFALKIVPVRETEESLRNALNDLTINPNVMDGLEKVGYHGWELGGMVHWVFIGALFMMTVVYSFYLSAIYLVQSRLLWWKYASMLFVLVIFAYFIERNQGNGHLTPVYPMYALCSVDYIIARIDVFLAIYILTTVFAVNHLHNITLSKNNNLVALRMQARVLNSLFLSCVIVLVFGVVQMHVFFEWILSFPCEKDGKNLSHLIHVPGITQAFSLVATSLIVVLFWPTWNNIKNAELELLKTQSNKNHLTPADADRSPYVPEENSEHKVTLTSEPWKMLMTASPAIIASILELML